MYVRMYVVVVRLTKFRKRSHSTTPVSVSRSERTTACGQKFVRLKQGSFPLQSSEQNVRVCELSPVFSPKQPAESVGGRKEKYEMVSGSVASLNIFVKSYTNCCTGAVILHIK